MFSIEIDTDGLATITFDMPDRSANVWNQDSLDALADVVERITNDDAIKGAVFTSGKTTFIAGADLDDIERIAQGGQDPAELTKSCAVLSQLFRRMERCKKPLVAAIGGAALGGGYEFCLACHYRIAANDQKVVVGLPESQLGLLPGAGGTQRLPWLIGIKASLPLLLEGKQLTGEKALRAGLIDALVPGADMVAAAKTWIRESGHSTQPWDVKGAKIPHGSTTDGHIRSMLMVAIAMYQEKTFGNYPAGQAILSCIYEGLASPMDVGLGIETRYFVSLLIGPVAPRMVRTLFLSLQDANKLVRRPQQVPKTKTTKVGIIGAGLMGAGIAFSSAKSRIEVVLVDRDLDSAERGKAYSEKRLDKAIARGRSTPEKKAVILGRITPSIAYEDLADCQLVIEAVFEDRDVKASVTKKAEAVLSAQAVIASNTSTLPISGLAEAAVRQANFIGLHFFSPVEKMPLVEVIKGRNTSDEALALALDFVQQIGKTPIVVNDARGFYTSRVFGTYITEGMSMLSEGIKPTLIEQAGRMSGMPMPPLGLADEVGLGLMHQVGKQTRADLGDEAPYNPSTPILEKMVVDLDRKGRSNQAGFYAYSEKEKALWPELGIHFPASQAQPGTGELIIRYLYVQAIEAARCMAEGVLLAAADADVGAIMGWGFAPYTGGPLSYIDSIGLPEFVAEADRLASTHGHRFQVPDLLRSMARDGHMFYGTNTSPSLEET